MNKGSIKQKITADYILDMYAHAQRKKGAEKEELMKFVRTLSTHLNEFLVVDEKKGRK